MNEYNVYDLATSSGSTAALERGKITALKLKDKRMSP